MMDLTTPQPPDPAKRNSRARRLGAALLTTVLAVPVAMHLTSSNRGSEDAERRGQSSATAAERPVQTRTPAAPPTAPRPGRRAAEAAATAPGRLSPYTRRLAGAAGQGEPLALSVDGADPQTLLLRPSRLLGEGFQVTVGADRGRARPAAVRTYTGRVLDGTAGKLGGRAVLVVVDGAVAAVVEVPGGGLLHVRSATLAPGAERAGDNDDASPGGTLLALAEPPGETFGTCAHDHEAGIFTTTTTPDLAAAPPLSDAAWAAAARPATLEAAPSAPAALPAGGIDPGTGRLDKYVEPIPWGNAYDRSLKDMLALIVLDKDATGANTDGNLARKTSEYLARMANLATVHEHQLGVRLLVQELVLTPADDSLPDVDESVSGFRSWIGANRARGTYQWNLAAKFGLIGASGGTIGIAYVGALNGGSGVSVNRPGFTHALVAHEMGHNMGSGHSSGGIMNASIQSGSRDFFRDVSQGRTAAKANYDHSRSRLGGSAEMRHPEQIPFADDDSRSTAPGTVLRFHPLNNDERSVRNGEENTALSLVEVGRVNPLGAGRAEVEGEEVVFTPEPGYEGVAHFSYTVRGNVGNGGRGWLHKGDVAVEVGAYDPNGLDLSLAPGQHYSFRPSGGDLEIRSQPRDARADTARDDRRLIILRADADAAGTDSFVFRQGGSDKTVNITYLDDYLQTRADVFVFDGEGGNASIAFDPTLNDQGAGYRHPISVNPLIGAGNNPTTTFYFRHRFEVDDPAALGALGVELLRDDGARVFLNGTEVLRDNLPGGAIDGDTLASGTAGGADETTYFAFDLTAGDLVAGTNVVAAEVHQASTTSSDVAFDLALLAARAGGGTEILVPRGAEWTYWATGDVTAGWEQPGFNDGGSRTEISFGGDEDNKFLTAYFRRTFTVADASTNPALELRVRRDDGIAVYLNGTEVARDNLPGGALDASTRASGTASDDGEDWHAFTLDPALLRDGENLLAAEVHQASPTSSDTVFDLELEGAGILGNRVTLVAPGSAWRYLDDGSDPGPAWRMDGFDDGAWGTGPAPLGYPFSDDGAWASGPAPLGFGDGREATSLLRGGEGRAFFPGAFRLVSATNLSPEKGSLTESTRRFTVDGAGVDALSGKLTFTPAPGATGVANVSYTVEDATGAQQTNTVSVILPLVGMTSPAERSVVMAEGNGLLLEGVVHAGGDPPLSGVVTPSWTAESAPAGGAITFGDPRAAVTTAEFSQPGTYRIRLTGDDSGFSTFEETEVTVEAGGSDGGPQRGLLARWKLDDALGNTVADASSNGLDGTRQGYAGGFDGWVPGIAGGALEFDGGSQYVRLREHATTFQALTTGTVAAWFRTNTSSERTIFSASHSADTDRDIRLYVDDGLLKFKVRGDTGTDEASVRSAAEVNDDQWHHAAVTVDPAGNALLYLDGEAVAAGPRPFFAAVHDIDRVAIGRTTRNGAGANTFRGTLDDVRVYNTVLTPAEVSSLARAGLNRAPGITLPQTRPRVPAPSFDLAVLAPRAEDDGLPADPGRATVRWTQVGGPPGQTVTFDDANAVETTARFPAPGNYTLRLEASDGAVATFDEITVEHTGGGPGVPLAVGAPDLVIPQNSPPAEVDLHAAFEDDADPDGALTYAVTENANPALFTSVQIDGGVLRLATTGAEGTAALTVRATDRDGNAVETAFRLTVVNFKPRIADQLLRLPENSAAGTAVGSVVAEDADGDAVSVFIVGGNAGGTFSLDARSGELTVADPTALNFETRPVIELRVAATDAANPGLENTATVRVDLTDVNEPPLVPEQRLLVDRAAGAGTDVGAVQASDPEGRALTYALTGGNTGGAFALGAGDGFLTVANPGALNIDQTPRFNLEVEVADTATPALTTTATVRVTLSATLVADGDDARWQVPTDGAAGISWRGQLFDDGGWEVGPTGVGYDTNDDYDDHIRTDVEDLMSDINETVYLRMHFDVGDPDVFGTLMLRMKYDDGFAAFLNGQPIASRNAPFVLAWDSGATAGHEDSAAIEFEEIPLDASVGALVAGPNLLAIHGLNDGTGSSDLLITPELVATGGGTASAPDPPRLEVGGAAAITQTSATVTGRLLAEGGATPELFVVWGERDGDTDPEAWTHRAVVAAAPGAGEDFTVDLDGLEPGTDYFFRFFGTNAGGTGWTDAAGTFTTLSPPPLVLLPEGAAVRVFLPTAEPAGDWRAPGFLDAFWPSGTTGVGYEQNSGYEDLIGIDVGAGLFDRSTSALLRLRFDVANPAGLETLTLRMKYDDGFVAYLNGLPVARANAPEGDQLPWDAAATGDHPDAQAVVAEAFDLTSFIGALVPGENLLAVHGLNNGAGSSDLLILPEVVATGDPDAPAGGFEDWAGLEHGLTGAAAAPDADPDNDGVSNLLEFATGGDPNDPSDGGAGADRLPAAALEEGPGGRFLTYTYRRRINHGAAGLAYAVETAADLEGTWSTAGLSEDGPPQDAGDGRTEWVTVRVDLPVEADEARFVRLVVRLLP